MANFWRHAIFIMIIALLLSTCPVYRATARTQSQLVAHVHPSSHVNMRHTSPYVTCPPPPRGCW